VSRLLKDLDAGGHIAVSRTQIVLKRPLPARW
jgi:CRP/FNR family cyclic AMP-dependent transcriptional regulator